MPLQPIPSEHLTVIHSASQRGLVVRRASATGPSESTGWSRLDAQWRSKFNWRILSLIAAIPADDSVSSPRNSFLPASGFSKGCIHCYKAKNIIWRRSVDRGDPAMPNWAIGLTTQL
jgi:hypothetical protein